jgi:cbb3-type cytochrome oxidase cytochrome c subunit
MSPPNVDGIVDPSLAVKRAGLRCVLCGSKGATTDMLVCDKCSRGWHVMCMTPPMDVVPAG